MVNIHRKRPQCMLGSLSTEGFWPPFVHNAEVGVEVSFIRHRKGMLVVMMAITMMSLLFQLVESSRKRKRYTSKVIEYR
jgi:hypothetical protein